LPASLDFPVSRGRKDTATSTCAKNQMFGLSPFNSSDLFCSYIIYLCCVYLWLLYNSLHTTALQTYSHVNNLDGACAYLYETFQFVFCGDFYVCCLRKKISMWTYYVLNVFC